jgi:streptogramin lyase
VVDSFNPNASSNLQSIVVQADGKILVAGSFNGANSIGGQPRNRIARLDPTTGVADSFNPNSSTFIFALAVQADGKILAGSGVFTSIGGQARNGIARLDPTTGLADSFNPNANGQVPDDGSAGGRPDCRRWQFYYHRRTDAQPPRPARSDHWIGGFVQPERG